MDLIDKKIKELYNNDKALFSEKINVHPTNFSKKLKTIENQMAKVNAFLEPLNLEIEIKEKEERPLFYATPISILPDAFFSWLVDKGYIEKNAENINVITPKNFIQMKQFLKEYEATKNEEL